MAAALNQLALLHKLRGEYEQAEALYRRSLAAYEKSCGPRDDACAQVLENLAALYKATGAKGGQSESLQRAAEIRAALP